MLFVIPTQRFTHLGRDELSRRAAEKQRRAVLADRNNATMKFHVIWFPNAESVVLAGIVKSQPMRSYRESSTLLPA